MWQGNNFDRVPGNSTAEGRLHESGPYSKETGDENKTTYDSQTDSGYLSGQIASSSSLTCESDLNLDSGSRYNLRPPDENKSRVELSGSNIDSGLDLSEQLSALNITSAPSSTSSTTTNVFSNIQHDPIHNSRNSQTDDGSRLRIGLSHEHLSLLKEIFRRDDDGDTALHVAVSRGFVEVIPRITRLLPHQALLDLCNDKGSTPLHVAVLAGNPEIIRHLIVCGSSPVIRDSQGNTPLHLACQKGDTDAVAKLTNPVDVTEVLQAQLLYHPSLRAGLLAADLTNYIGETCIHVAVKGGHTEILRHLSFYGADINAKEGKAGRTALHYAVELRDLNLVSFVVKNCGASLTLETYGGLTPYQLAVINGENEIAQVLLDLGAQDEPLPESYDFEDDLDFDGSSVLDDAGLPSGCLPIDDLKIAGNPFNMATPVPVSTCAPLNADGFF